MVRVYVLFGVRAPFTTVAVVVVLPQAGIRRRSPLITNRLSTPHAFLVLFPPAAAPKPTKASIGKGSQSA
jgi:hypothetical protein